MTKKSRLEEIKPSILSQIQSFGSAILPGDDATYLLTEVDQLRARLKDAEGILHYLSATVRRMGYDDENPPQGLLGDLKTATLDYFSRHGGGK